jgi:2-C-methyl-D-erythritol 4-phosphate cytidylyltransferase
MPASGSVAALVLAAGRGERLGHALPKAFVPIAGRTLIEHSIRALSASGSIGMIVPVLEPDDMRRWKDLGLESTPGLMEPVEGGAERQDSMQAGLDALPEVIEFVAVHDAARCLVAAEDIRAVVSAAQQTGAAILGERVRDTIKRVVDGLIVETPARDECWAAQTPQVIRRDWLTEAIAAARRDGRLATDDAQLIEWLENPVQMVEAHFPNPKITRPEDLVLAEALLEKATGSTERADP